MSKNNHCVDDKSAFSINDVSSLPEETKEHSARPIVAASIYDKRIWRVCDVAEFLGCSVGHIYNLVSDEKIPRIKKGKFIYFVPDRIQNWVLEGD